MFRHTQCVTLTLSNNDNLENTDVHLRCNNEDKMLPPVRWTQKTPIQAAIMSFQNNICSANSGFIQDSSRYSYDCTDGKTFIVTIKSISREINGQIWLCDFGNSNTASNEITIYVNGNLIIKLKCTFKIGIILQLWIWVRLSATIGHIQCVFIKER